MKYSSKEKSLWENQYESGKNVPTISNERDVPATTIYAHLKKSNVETRSNAGRQRKYDCNDEYFSEINTPNKAYWLGVITADGWVKHDQNRSNIFGLGLKHEDKSHVQKLKRDIKADNPINDYKQSGQSVLKISSSRLCKDLERFGILPNKTKSVNPANIKKHFKKDYWRGLIDGDGRVGTNKNRHGNQKPSIELYGNFQMVRGFSKYVKSFCETKAKPNKKDENVWRVGYTNRIAAKILETLYGNKNRALKRKKKAAQKAIKIYDDSSNPASNT